MNLAYTFAPGRGDTNRLLSDLAQELEARGMRLCGTVQQDTPREKEHMCDMDVRVLPEGPTIRISQSLGADAKGCRLNPNALEEAVAITERELPKGADLLIVNKFGKHEADGRGFRDAIASALALGIPVLVGASKTNVAALAAFSEGMAVELPPEPEVLRDWVNAHTAAG